MDADRQVERAEILACNTSSARKEIKAVMQSATSLLDLPADVRNMVYNYLFPEGRSSVQLLERTNAPGYIQLSERLGILTTCRQVYQEATSFLRLPNRLNIKKPISLDDLLYTILWEDEDDSHISMLDYFHPSGAITFDWDLDHQTLVRNAPALMDTSQWFHDNRRWQSFEIKVTARLCTQSVKSDFEGFEKLREWVNGGHADLGIDYSVMRNMTQIILKFESVGSLDPGLVRFDATSFLHATERLDHPCTAVEVQVSDRDIVRSSIVTQNGIDSHQLVFMWRLIQENPADWLGTCPKIWVDGTFLPREAEFTSINGDVRLWTADLDVGLRAEYDALDGIEETYTSTSDSDEDVTISSDSLLGVAMNLAQIIGRWL